MKKETEGYFVIKGKKTDWYITDGLFPSKNKEDAKPFETRTAAYKYMHELNLEKNYIIEELK